MDGRDRKNTGQAIDNNFMNNTGGLDQFGNSLGNNVPARQQANTVAGNRKTVAFASANDSESIKYSDNIDN